MAKNADKSNDIERTIKETKAVMKSVRQYVEFLESGKGLPKDPEARQKVIDSHRAMVANFETEIAGLKAARKEA